MPGAVLLSLYALLLVAPLALAAAQGLPRRPFLDDLSSGLAMAGFAALLAEFVLSGRFRWVSRSVGMDVTMRFHQLLARTVLGLLLLHPFLYTLPVLTAPPPWDPTAAGWLRLDGWPIVTGAVAWVGLGALVVTGMGRDRLGWRYEMWRLGHGVGALLVAAAALHHTLTAGRHAQDATLAWLWAGLAGAAVATLAWVWLLAPLLRLRAPFRIEAVAPVAERTWALTVAREDGRPFRHTAGQFAWLRVAPHPFGVADNPFSISSAPAAGGPVEFLIKEAGDFTNRVGALAPGTRCWLDGPHGSLTPPRRGAGVGLIAGGVGLAPLLGVLREMRATGDARPVRLLYGNRHAGQIVGGAELERLLAPPSRLVHVLSEPPADWRGATGVIDAATVRAALGDLPDLRDWRFLLCGPPGMIAAAEAALLAIGAPPSAIRAERFVYD